MGKGEDGVIMTYLLKATRERFDKSCTVGGEGGVDFLSKPCLALCRTPCGSGPYLSTCIQRRLQGEVPVKWLETTAGLPRRPLPFPSFSQSQTNSE